MSSETASTGSCATKRFRNDMLGLGHSPARDETVRRGQRSGRSRGSRSRGAGASAVCAPRRRSRRTGRDPSRLDPTTPRRANATACARDAAPLRAAGIHLVQDRIDKLVRRRAATEIARQVLRCAGATVCISSRSA